MWVSTTVVFVYCSDRTKIISTPCTHPRPLVIAYGSANPGEFRVTTNLADGSRMIGKSLQKKKRFQRCFSSCWHCFNADRGQRVLQSMCNYDPMIADQIAGIGLAPRNNRILQGSLPQTFASVSSFLFTVSLCHLHLGRVRYIIID